jgi:hypothetical protein
VSPHPDQNAVEEQDRSFLDEIAAQYGRELVAEIDRERATWETITKLSTISPNR